MTGNPTAPVPHLSTALTGPLKLLESQILDQQIRIESWFRSEWRKTPAPFYASVDLRNAGFKIAPVDTNLFPAGFNNLNPVFESLCIQSVQQAVEHLGRPIDRIAIIPENHTRNLFYLENVAVLERIMQKAGFEVRVGSLMPDLQQPLAVDLPSGNHITLNTSGRSNGRLKIGDFDPDLIVLNNDLASGVPDLLTDIEQLIIPAIGLGWSQRLKSEHFGFYRDVATELADLIGIDPWLIDPMFRNCGEVDFMKREGESCLSANITVVLNEIQKKYDEYNVDSKPFVIVKADSGSYGMGVITLHSAEEVLELNRKQRSKMATTKEGQKITKAIIQEGVYTNETWEQADTVAEPVVYMIDQNVVGGFYRVHNEKASDENLNSPGMRFEMLAFDECCNSPDRRQAQDAHPNRFYTYGVIARLALLAAARESGRHN
ncbi:MAG: glutamate--cysteine ligase [Gammaproteobacteria bacterium]